MLSIKEMVDKTEVQRKTIMDSLERRYYDFEESNLLLGQGKEDRQQILETLRTISLTDIIRRSGDDMPWVKPKIKEFLAKSGTTGIAGAAYLIPDKIYQIMFDSAVASDIVADISIALIPPDQIPGSTLKVDIAVDDSYVPKKYSSGASMPTETIKTTQATLDFSTSWGINFQIGNDLIEDAQFDLIEMHLRNAGREMGEYATNEAITVLMTSTDGDGTLNTESAGADVTTFTDVLNGVDTNTQDGYISDIYLCSHHLIGSEIFKDTTYTMDATGVRDEFVREFYPKRLLGMNVVYSECDMLTKALGTGNAFEDLNSYCLTKEKSLISGRKRWLRIEKYSDPIRDLVGATVTARQDSVSVYNDSICRIRES